MNTTNGTVEQLEQHTIAKALAHPLRATLLQLLAEGQASPNELANKIDEPLTNVSYHVRQLFELGLLELVDQRPARGALEHFYRARVRNARVEYETV